MNIRNDNETIQRPSAEILYEKELEKLRKEDEGKAKPPGWLLSPISVLDFVLGSKGRGLEPKFVGRKSFLECCIVALATNRGLMLIGEPGTAKSYLSELLAAAISGDSKLTIQGSAGTTEDQIKYSWNYALLLSEGPTQKALVEAPLYKGMREGKLVRFEELSRCPVEIQDSLLAVLSDRILHVPELEGGDNVIYAAQGFNVIATSNTRDRGVNEMSAALKRRFNFETVNPIQKLSDELDLVKRETERLLKRAGVPMTLDVDKTEVLVTMFHELRNAITTEGKALESMGSILSTAEAVSVAFSSATHAYYYNNGKLSGEHIVANIQGSAIKDSAEDLKKLKHYFEHIVSSRKSDVWREIYKAKDRLGE